MKDEASSLERKVKKLQQQERGERWNTFHWFCSKVFPRAVDVAIHEEKLKDLNREIRLLQCDATLRHKELPVAFVSFNSRVGATHAAETQQHINPLLLVTNHSPEPSEVMWKNLAIPYRRMALYKLGVFVAAFLVTVFFAIPVTAVQGIVQFEKIKKWFPPAEALQLIPGLSSVITGFLPSVILNSFMYLVPYIMVAMASLEGCISKSKMEIKACSMVFYFLLGNVFFLSLLSGSLWDLIGESFAHPKYIPGRLAWAVSAQSDFFITYILTDGMSGFSLEVLQLGLLTWHFVKAHSITLGTRDPYLYSFPYYRVVPIVSLAILIGMVYSVIAPLMLPFLILYFLLGYAVYVNQMHDVYDITYDTFGQYWPHIHHYIFLSLILMQITMIGLFGLKSKPAASFATIPLLILTITFNEYCKVRFRPTFRRRPIENARDDDDMMDSGRDDPISAYKPPWMRPVNFANEAISVQPLVIP